MNEQRRSGREFTRAISVALAVACVAVCCAYVVTAISFGSAYAQAVRAASILKSFPPPGSIDLQPAEAPKLRVPLDDAGKQRLTEAVQGMPLALRAVEQGIVDGDRFSADAKVIEAAATLRQGDVTVVQRDQLLQYLADAPFQSSSQPQVIEALRQVAARQDLPNAEIFAAAVRTWGANDVNLRQLAGGRQVAPPSRNVVTFIISQTARPTPPAELAKEPREERPLRDFSVSVLAGFDIASTQPTVQPKTDSPADATKPRLLEPTLAQLLDPNTAGATVKALLALNEGDPLRRQIAELGTPTIREQGVAFNKNTDAAEAPPIPQWYEILAVAWRDQHMLDTLLELGPPPDAIASNPDMLKRLARWGAASGEPKWTGVLLERLPQRVAPPLQDAPPRIFAENSWEAVVAETLSELSAADAGPMTGLIDEPTLAGAVARYVFTRRTNWPDDMIARVVRSAAAEDGGVSCQWVELASVDDDTRTRMTAAVAQLDAPLRRRAWEQLRAVIHPFQIEDVASEVLGEKNAGGKLWEELPKLLAMRAAETLNVVASVLAERHESSGFADAEQQRAVARTIDAHLARRLLQHDTGSGDSFLKVADDYGGSATMRLLTDELPELEKAGGDAKWTPAQVAATIDRIQSRLLLEGGR